MPCRSCIETLERRVLLAAVGNPGNQVPLRYVDGAAIATIEWMGQPAEMFAGRWVVQLDGFSGYLLDQADQARQVVEAADNVLKLSNHLGGRGLFLVTAPIDMHPDAVMDRARQLPGFRTIEPDFAYRVNAMPNDSFFSSQWGLHNTGQSGGTVDVDIDGPEAWDTAHGATDIVVGMVDTGIDYTHPDLNDNIFINTLEIANNGVDDDFNGYVDDVRGWDFHGNFANPTGGDNDPMDQVDHGTHTAGIVAAEGNNGQGISGVAWNVKLLPLKIGGSGQFVSGAAAITAMQYALDLKQRFNQPVNLRVTNHSWGGTGFSGVMNQIINFHASNNIITVAAAGNGGPDFIGDNNDVIPHYPASYNQPNVIAVANHNRTNGKDFSSNYGPTSVDIAAPGTEIISTIRPAFGSYAFFDGTSMSSPMVAGAAAVVWSANPNLTYTQVRDAILNTAEPVPAFAGLTVTGGRLNLAAALATIAAPAAPNAPDLTNPSDSGISPTDNITRDSTPTFSGLAPAGLTVKLYADAVEVGSVVVPPTQIFQVTASTLADGVHAMTLTLTNLAGTSPHSNPLNVTIDTTAPEPVGSFRYQNSPHTVRVEFGEPVGHSVANADFLFENTDTSQPVTHSGSYDGGDNASTMSFDGVPVLPDGNYRMTVFSSGAGNGITDVAGNAMAANYVLDFKFLTGDADNDGVVNLADFNILANNFGQTGRDYSQGNFDYDPAGTVSLADFNLLANKFGTSLSAAASTASAGTSTTRRAAGDGRSPAKDLFDDREDDLPA